MTGSSDRAPRHRSPRRGSTPTFSVVIISSGNREMLDGCMARLGDACSRFDAELIVMVPASEADVASIRKRYPSARVVAGPADLGPGELRSMGLQEAAGDIVAFTDERETRGADWLSVLERRARTDGGYGPTPNGQVDWARYLEEHGFLRRNGHDA